MNQKRYKNLFKKHIEILEKDFEQLKNILEDVERISFYLDELPLPEEAKKSFKKI